MRRLLYPLLALLIAAFAWWRTQPDESVASAGAPPVPVERPVAPRPTEAERTVELAAISRERVAASSEPRSAVEPPRSSPVAEDEPPPNDEPPTSDEEFEVFEGGGERPPDPVETGPAVLYLRLVDDRDEAPLASHVKLYRLGAPGNADWTEGDQLQVEAHVPVEGHWFRDLPEGRYRAMACAASRTAPAPEPMDVVAPETQVRLRIVSPRERAVRLRLVDRYGEPIESTRLRHDPAVDIFGDADRPEWLNARRLQPRDGDYELYDSSMSASSWGTPAELGERRSAEGLYELGPLVEENACGGRRERFAAVRPGWSEVACEFQLRRPEDLRLIGVQVPLDDVYSAIRLPDGRDGRAVAEHLRAWSSARDDRGGDLERWLDEVEVQVELDAPGFEPLQFVWTPADGPPPIVTLTPR